MPSLPALWPIALFPENVDMHNPIVAARSLDLDFGQERFEFFSREDCLIDRAFAEFQVRCPRCNQARRSRAFARGFRALAICRPCPVRVLSQPAR